MTFAKLAVLPLLIGGVALAGGCGRQQAVNPPTEPAQAINQPDVGPEATGSSGVRVAGAGPVSFVGRWTSDVSQCTGPQGLHRPLEITPIRFESADKSCHIFSIDETATGYLAMLQCQADDPERLERVHMSVVGKALTLTYLDRGKASVTLLKCTTLADVSPTRVAP